MSTLARQIHDLKCTLFQHNIKLAIIAVETNAELVETAALLFKENACFENKLSEQWDKSIEVAGITIYAQENLL